MSGFYYADNQPNYYTTMGPPLKEIHYEVLACSDVEHTDEEDMCDPTFQRVFVRVRKLYGHLDVRDIKSILARNHTPSRCGHEWDCCGCRHGYAHVNMLTMDTAEIEIYTSRNY